MISSGTAVPQHRFNLIDIFSGIGGFTVGFSETKPSDSWRIVPRLMVDLDSDARSVATRNMPHVPFLARDLGSLSGSEIRAAARLGERDAVDVLVGGPPCQGFSRLGRRALDDPRNALVLEYLRIVKELRPLVAVMENVPMVISAHDGAVMHEIAESLSRIGYSSVYENLLASDFGVPQHRKRAILVAYRAELGILPSLPRRTHERFGHAANLMERERRMRYEPDKLPFISVEDAIGDLPSLAAGEGEDVSIYGAPATTDYQRWARSGAIALFNHRSRAHSAQYLEKVSVIAEGGRNFDLPDDQRFSDTYFSQAYARLHRNGIAQTITTHFANPGSGRFLHYRDLRSITVREAARIQSFRDTYVFDGTAVTQMRHVGNAVPPLLASAIATLIGRDLAEVYSAGNVGSSLAASRDIGPSVTLPSRERSRTMKAVPSKDSKPELRLRRALSDSGVRGYRLHRKDLPGTPDISFSAARLAVFVDGCFWHGCDRCHRAPATNAVYWASKVAKNRKRDAEVANLLLEMGWQVVRVWEHEVNESPTKISARIRKLIGAATRAAKR